jgi:hypothetical protein
MDELQTGVHLCQLIEKIDPAIYATMGKVHKNAKVGQFFAHDNVVSFLNGCKKLGVSDHQVGASDALGSGADS